MSTSLQSKKCLITGAASGIGRAVAEAAAREGAELVLTDINAPQLEAVVAGIKAAGGTVLLSRAFDISSLEQVEAFAKEVHASAGSMDLVMNIAGISLWGTVENMEHKHWRKCVEINLMGPIHVIQCFVPEMIKAKRGGHLVNVSSAAGLFGLPWHAAYSATKFGLRGISEVLRFDLRRHRIKVSLVCPGGVDTGLVQTIQILGVDPDSNVMKVLKQRFRSHAVTPEVAARRILKGVKAGRYMVYTSFDIAFGHFFQRVFPWPYEWVMMLLNRQLGRAAKLAPAKPAVASATESRLPNAG